MPNKPKKVLFVPASLGTRIEIIVAHFGGIEQDRVIVRNLLRGIMEESYFAGMTNEWEKDAKDGITLCSFCGDPEAVICQNCTKPLCLKHRNVVMFKEGERETRVLCNDCLVLETSS